MWNLRILVVAFGILLSCWAVVGQEGAPGQESGEPDPETIQMLLEPLVEQAMSSGRQEFFDSLRDGLGAEHPVVPVVMAQVGVRLLQQGAYAEAKELFERVIESGERIWGKDHPGTLRLMNNLAQTLEAQGDLAAARELNDHVLAVRRRVLGEEHPDTLTSMNNLALTLHKLGELARARQLYEELIAIRENLAGPDHRPNTYEEAVIFNNLAIVHKDAENLKGARVFSFRALSGIEGQTQRADVSEGVKSRFRAQYSGIYQVAIATSLALKRQEEAFSITERYRAQSLLSLLSDEDLASQTEIPATSKGNARKSPAVTTPSTARSTA